MNLDELYLPSSQRNRELLYHATSVRNAFSVIYYNTLDDGTKQEFTNISWNNRYHKWGRDGGGVYGVSLTRSFAFAASFNPVVFCLDKQILKTKKRMVPFHFGNIVGDESPEHWKADEQEEFVFGKITNLDKCLVSIEIPSFQHIFDTYTNMAQTESNSYWLSILDDIRTKIIDHPKFGILCRNKSEIMDMYASMDKRPVEETCIR